MQTLVLSELEKHQNNLESLIQHCEDGQIQEKLNQEDCPPDIESLTYHNSKKKGMNQTNKNKEIISSSTQESQVTNKKMTSKGKKNTLKKSSSNQTPKVEKSSMFTILHPDLISKERGLSEFWMPSKKDKYDQLSWLPKIDWQGLDSTSSIGYVVSTEQKSWFSMTKIQHKPKSLEKTSSPSFKFIVANGMEAEDTKLPKTLKKTLKLRLFPTPLQKKTLNKWASASRYTYNKVIACLNNPRNNCRNWMKLRNRFVTAKRSNVDNNFFNNKKWLLDTPKSIRLAAVKEAVKNLKTCFTNKRKGNIPKFFLTFKSKKKEKLNGWSLGIEKNNVSKNGDELSIFSRLLGKVKYGRKKQLHKLIPSNKPKFDPRIQRDKFGDYYLVVVVEKNVRKPPKVHDSIKSYDPGCKIFLTGYDPNGKALLLGKGCDETIFSMLEQLDGLISEMSKVKGKAYNSVHQKYIRLRKRIYNYKIELQNQVNNIVAKSSTLILFPKLDTGKLTLKETRQLKTKTARTMLNLGHCTAYEKLKLKCLEHGSLLLTVSEAYTTKTCGCCGTLNTCNNDRIFNCSSCSYKAERDLNGGQNILLRSLG